MPSAENGNLTNLPCQRQRSYIHAFNRFAMFQHGQNLFQEINNHSWMQFSSKWVFPTIHLSLILWKEFVQKHGSKMSCCRVYTVCEKHFWEGQTYQESLQHSRSLQKIHILRTLFMRKTPWNNHQHCIYSMFCECGQKPLWWYRQTNNNVTSGI